MLVLALAWAVVVVASVGPWWATVVRCQGAWYPLAQRLQQAWAGVVQGLALVPQQWQGDPGQPRHQWGVLQWLACPLVVLVGRHVALACRRLAPCLALQLPPFPPKTFPPCTVLVEEIQTHPLPALLPLLHPLHRLRVAAAQPGPPALHQALAGQVAPPPWVLVRSLASWAC